MKIHVGEFRGESNSSAYRAFSTQGGSADEKESRWGVNQLLDERPPVTRDRESGLCARIGGGTCDLNTGGGISGMGHVSAPVT